MAYYLNKNKEKTYSETQGFTNGKLRIANTTRETGSTEVTTTASQVNEGAITEYPYKIDKKITVAPPHISNIINWHWKKMQMRMIQVIL